MHGFSDAGYLLAALAVLALAVFLAHRYRSYKAATAGGAGIGVTRPGPSGGGPLAPPAGPVEGSAAVAQAPDVNPRPRP